MSASRMNPSSVILLVRPPSFHICLNLLLQSINSDGMLAAQRESCILFISHDPCPTLHRTWATRHSVMMLSDYKRRSIGMSFWQIAINTRKASKYLKSDDDATLGKVPQLVKADVATTTSHREQAGELLSTFFPAPAERCRRRRLYTSGHFPCIFGRGNAP